jgi:hypothetical protein
MSEDKQGQGLHIGFTGTRYGMTEAQKTMLRTHMQEIRGDVFHHGDCIGADAEAHAIALEMGMKIVIPPPVDERHRAFCTGYTEMRSALSHFARNRAIVDESEILLVGPFQMERQSYGGTWFTHDYGLKRSKKVMLALPDGSYRSC